MNNVIAVSACLLGINSKYSGGNNYNPKIEELVKGKTVLPICPEVVSGLSTPRHPSEIIDYQNIKMDSGEDVTKEFYIGAYKTLEFLKRHNCNTVILKNGSPSCGNYTYDGTFTHRLVNRMGITAKILKENGFNLIYID